MSSGPLERVVFDCPIFAQALINPRGPAGACITLAQSGQITLFISEYVLREIRELPQKLKPKLGVTPERVEALIADIAKYAVLISDVPATYTHPIDPDDSPYINLAIAAQARLIASRDAHLLNLMDEARAEGKDFRRRFPDIAVVTPGHLLHEIRSHSASRAGETASE